MMDGPRMLQEKMGVISGVGDPLGRVRLRGTSMDSVREDGSQSSGAANSGPGELEGPL
jgi:hypothetical protein